MPAKIKPTGKQKRNFLLHFIVFAIVSVLLWTTYNMGSDEWVYPWPAWITAAWGLSLIGHGCLVYTSYEDKGYDVYEQQEKHG